MSLAVCAVVIDTLYVAREVLVPIALAVLLSFVLAPTVQLLRRARLGRIAAPVLAVVMALCVILALGGVIGTQVTALVSDLPRYTKTIETKVTRPRSDSGPVQWRDGQAWAPDPGGGFSTRSAGTCSSGACSSGAWAPGRQCRRRRTHGRGEARCCRTA